MTTIIEIDDIGSLVEKMAATEGALKRALERNNKVVVKCIQLEHILDGRAVQRNIARPTLEVRSVSDSS